MSLSFFLRADPTSRPPSGALVIGCVVPFLSLHAQDAGRLSVATVPIAAAEVVAAPTLSDVEAYALAHNPDLTTARLQVDSARGERRIARGLPNPTFTIAPGSPFQYSVTQPIDIGPSRLYRTRAAGQGIASVQLDESNVRRQVVFAVRQGYLDLLLAEATRVVAFEQDTIVRRLLLADSLRFREGDLALRDLSTTELQFAHAEAALARAEAGVRGARISLQVLMGVTHPDTAFRVTGALAYRSIELPPALASDSARVGMLAARADIAAAQSRVQQSQSLRALATSQLWPVPGVAAVYQPAPFESGSHYAIGASFSLPVLYWFSGERTRATAGVQSAIVAQQRTLTAAEGELVAARDNFYATQTLAARYAGGLLETARAALDMQRFAYEHGNASLLDLLNAINAFGDTRTDYYTAVHDYLMSAYAIDRAIGRDIIP
jgi:cobalt-zinc-cadmium efflux system outer membrane protein